MNGQLQDALEDLARRIVSGEVVFFVGAGCSIDSEGNTAQILIARLIARCEALTEYLSDAANVRPRRGAAKKKEQIVATAKELRRGLRKTFSLRPKLGDNEEVAGTVMDNPKCAQENIDRLAEQYYSINDWVCSAFETLLDCIECLREPEAIGAAIQEREQELLKAYQEKDPLRNTRQLRRMNVRKLLALHRHVKKPHTPAESRGAGKALFLDTMRFTDQEVMGGKPMDPDLKTVEASFRGRVLPRHHVPARLATEGLCPILLTTNYDLLLEGAYRLNGLAPRNPPKRWSKNEALDEKLISLRRHSFFTRIADATQFFSFGDGHRSALITKIHGCVESYRIARDRKGNLDPWAAILATMVCTYREIQHWREDSWSRDFLRTLLRTRTIVFCGYSGADPVLHDTFRTVYEEMAATKERQKRAGINEPAAGGQQSRVAAASAYFMDMAHKQEFHALEILRAASRAQGVAAPPLTSHPNLLPFHRAGKPGFPSLDEMMRWLFHLAYRERQAQAFESELRRVAGQLLGHPCPEPELKRIKGRFEALRRRERGEAAEFTEGAPQIRRRQFERMAGWTEHFHIPLIRAFALAELSLSETEPNTVTRQLSELPWYCPIGDHADWAAWAVVLEIALRRRIAAWRGVPAECWPDGSPWVEAIEHSHPAVLFAENSEVERDRGAADDRRPLVAPVGRVCLMIRLSTLNRAGRATRLRVPLRRRPPLVWTIGNHGVPWWGPTDRTRPQTTPSAAAIWEWAADDHPPDSAGSPFDAGRQAITSFFSDDDGKENRRSAA